MRIFLAVMALMTLLMACDGQKKDVKDTVFVSQLQMKDKARAVENTLRQGAEKIAKRLSLPKSPGNRNKSERHDSTLWQAGACGAERRGGARAGATQLTPVRRGTIDFRLHDRQARVVQRCGKQRRGSRQPETERVVPAGALREGVQFR